MLRISFASRGADILPADPGRPRPRRRLTPVARRSMTSAHYSMEV